MGITELVRNAKYEEGKIEGMKIGIAIFKLINEGKSIDYISKKFDLTEKTLKIIQSVIDKQK